MLPTRRAEGARGRSTRRSILRLAGLISGVVGAAFALGGLASGHDDYVVRSVGPLVVALFVYAQIVLGRESLIATLMAAAVVPTLQVKALGVDETEVGAIVGLIAIGIAGLIALDSHRVLYIAGYSAFIVFAEYWWWWDTGADPSWNALSGAAAFVGGCWVMIRLQQEEGAASSRHHHLFATAPMPLWEEDFTAVAAWLADRRTAGVDDLDAYLAANPGALRDVAGLIEVRDVNDEAVLLLEAHDREELIGRLDVADLPEEALGSIAAQVTAVWESRDRVSVDLVAGRTRTGRPLEAVVHWAAPRVDDRLDLTRVVVAIVDVTDSREARRHLEDLLRSKDEFVATVSHELRTPLTAVVGLAEELHAGGDHIVPGEAKELIGLIASQAQEVSTIVEDLLVAAQAGTGTLTVVNEPLDLPLEVSNVLKAMGADGIVPLHTWGPVPTAQGDPGRVRQVVRNLVSNAQRYGGPRVRIVVVGDEARVTAEVRDTGGPIPEHQRAAIFDPYYRARQMVGVTASVGLGLTVSRELARLMEGDLGYFHDGEESVFALTLPRALPGAPDVRP
jgi:signal transduction histidine kinase